LAIRRLIFIAILLSACEGNSRSAELKTSAAPTQIGAASSTLPTVQPPEADTSTRSALVTTPWVNIKQVMDTSLDAPNFQCAPKQFTLRDTITLRAEVPHGGQLSVVTPDGTIYPLIFPLGEDPKTTALMPPATFENTLITRFRADIRQRPAIYGRDTVERIFRKPGDYTFILGSNLETEVDDEANVDIAFWRCTITLVPDR
jgi:hypothetical protein